MLAFQTRTLHWALLPAIAYLILVAATNVVRAQGASVARISADTPQICDSLSHDMIGDLNGTWMNDGETVTVTHVGSSVTGIAFYTEGGSATYTGCFDGTTFYLSYNNAVDDGYAQLTLSADGNTLQGYYVSNLEDGGPQHPWTLQRVVNP